MEKEILKNLVEKFKALKEANEDYRTWRDTVLAEAFKEAEEFLAKDQPDEDKPKKKKS